ncbi:methyltransferase domain-containing protein [Abortiporus biennis]|nr:methyltransferase domain-containing protein [Abortiporus biennis]
MQTMATSARNPRLIVLALVLCAGVLYLFLHTAVSTTFYETRDPTLQDRLGRSEKIYQSMLKNRSDMIRKFGPRAEDVVMFPPDKDPWPAYTAWDFFPPAFNCPHERERIGVLGDGGKWVCGLSRIAHKPDCIIYSFGISGGSSFEAELLSRTKHCQIYAYDPRSKGLGWDVPKSLKRSRTHFKPFQLAEYDAYGPTAETKLWTLKSLMAANGHNHIDILKIDLEGWEFKAMTEFIRPFIDAEDPLPIGQLHMEIHTWGKKFKELLTFFKDLEDAGLRPFMRESNLVYTNYNRASDQDLVEYSFLNTQGSNIFIEDPVQPNVHGQRSSR